MALVGDMNYLTINGDTYEIADADARQDLALKAPIASPVFTGTPTAPTPGESAGDTEIATVKYVQDAVSGGGSGSVTSVGISNASNGGLTVSGSPITSSGTITVGHSNILTNAQTTSGVYPIKIDKNGHISEYGTAVTSMPASDVSAWAKEATKPTYTYSEVGAAASSHTHGNITNGGDITATAPTIANGDQIIINDDSASKITNGPIFDGSTTTKALTPKGTWETFLQSFIETDPIFSASPAAGITSTDINNWNAKVSDDKTWNGVTLNKQTSSPTWNIYLPYVGSTSNENAYYTIASTTPTANYISKYDANSYLYSTTPSANDNSTKVATTAYVDSAITALPEPMIFKGSLGTGGTITSLPAASSSNEGFTYKVITAGTYDSQTAKVGDTFISDGNNWILIPSGDEPSGTVTSVGVSNATNGGLSVSGSPVTSSGTITVGHSNILTSAQTTSAVYPIKIDKNGHISEYGSAVTVPSITLNGSSTTSPSFYAPTTAGTNGYVLKSNGSGAPTWTSATLTDTKVTQTNDTTTSAVRPILLGYDVGANETTEKVYKAYSDLTYNPSTKALVLNGTINGYTLAAASAKAVDSSISANSSSTNLPTSAAVASFVEGKGYITGYTETDPVFTASAAYGISSSDITNWNNKLDTSYTGSSTSLSVGYASNSGGTLNIVGMNSAGTVGTAINLTQSLRVASMGTSNKSIELLIGSSGLNTYVNTSSSGTSIFSINTTNNTVTLHNLVTPTNDSDAATKKYVDDLIPTVPSNIVNTITTTAGAHTAITSQTGNVSFNVPTKTSHLTNDSGFVTTDEKVKQTPRNSTNGYRNVLLAYSLNNTETNEVLKATNMTYNDYGPELSLTSSSDSTKEININGTSIQYKTGTYYATLDADTQTSNHIMSLPDKSGTIALTSDIPTYSRQTPASGGTTLSLVNTGDMYTWNNKSKVQIVTWSEE